MRIQLRFVSLLVSIATLGACSKTSMTNMWMSEPTSPAISNIFVIALDRNPEMRRFWEDALSAEFQAQGMLARPSYQLFPADLPDSQQVAVVLTRDRHDAALVTQRINVVTNAAPSGGYRENPPAAYKDYWRRGYMVALTAANQPVTSDKKDDEARFQLDLARANGTLVWTGQTTPLKVTDADKLRAEVAGQVVPELQRKHVVMKE